MKHFVHPLSNGIRVLYVPSESPITHACVLINAGSRDEEPSQCGLAHFLEHVLFKKTKKRSTYQILNRMEAVGGDLNAYTTKEYTCLHASFLQQHLERSLELFHDILFNSVFPENEIEKEKGIILDEIASYQDSPEEAIQDDFEDLLFKGHALGRNILGTEDTVSQISRNHLFDFISKYYQTSGIVIAVMGNYDFQKILKWTDKYFSEVKENRNAYKRVVFKPFPPVHVQQQKPIVQTHMIMGNTAYDINHPDKVALLLLNNYLGGLGMSSRLNLLVREKYGIAYTIESNYVPFTDTGMFNIYFGTDEEKSFKAQKLIENELHHLCKYGLNERQLVLAKQKFIGQIALGEENRISLIISMAKSLIDYQKIDSLETIFNKINSVTTDQIYKVANEILAPNLLSSLKFSPNQD